MELNLPPLEEQKKIAEILSTWDRAIESLNVKFNQHLSFENAVIEKLFIEERNWNVSAISDLASSEPNSFKDGDWVEAPHIKDFGVRLLQTGNVGVGQIRNTNKRYISEASFDELGCKEVRVGDILICRLADPIGRCCIVPDLGESKYITSVDVIIFRPKSEIHRSFLIASLNRPAVLAKAASVSGGSTRQRVSRTAYGSITIGLPDPEHQRRIGEIWQLLTQMRSEILQQIELVTKQKQGLMQKLLTGKVRVKV
jgi:type I restriction enzyme S subunit